MKTLLASAAMMVIGLIMLTATATAQTFLYDAVGRIAIVRYDTGLETRYTYDKNGNITSVRTQVINSVNEGSTEVTEAQVIPNPASSNAVVVLGELVSGMDVVVKVRDLAGRMLAERTARAEGDRISLDVSTLATGSYLLECSYQGTVRTVSLRIVR